MIRFRFRATLPAALSGGDVDSDVLSEIAERYAMEVIGPVPEGYV